MFRKFFIGALGLFLAFNFSTDAANSAQGENLKVSAGQKVQILRAINLSRASLNLKPLRFSKSHTEVGLAKTADGITSGGSISGQLFSEEGDLNTFGFITAWSADSTDDSGVTMATVYPDGFYKLENLNPGDYYVLAIAEGFVPMFYDQAFNFHEATLVPIAEGDAMEGVDFNMQRTIPGAGSISGSVSGEFTDNTIAGTEISVWSPDNPFFFGMATTDDNGAYIITGLKTGDYYAAAFKEGYLMEFYENAESMTDAIIIQVIEPDETPGINFTLNEGGKISGRVTDEDGNGIANATIEAASNFGIVEPDPTFSDSALVNSWGFALTDENGDYLISGLYSGDYYVSVRAGDAFVRYFEYYDDAQSIENATPVGVIIGEETSGIDFNLPLTIAKGALSGSVKNVLGEPLAYAFIEVTNAPNVVTGVPQPQIWAYANSDSNGFYRVTGLPEGEYIARAQYWQDDNFGQQWYDHQDSYESADRIVLTQDDTLTGVNFDLDVQPYYGAIAGVVINEETGDLIERAYIEITPTDFQLYFSPIYYWPYYAITNELGEYSLDWLPQGEYVVTAYANGAFEYYENAFSAENATLVKVAGGETTTIDFGITKKNDGPGVISGQVYSEVDDVFNHGFLGIGIIQATMIPTEPTGANPEAVYTAVSNLQGHYEITGLPTGDFIVYAYSPNHIGEYYEGVFDPAEATIIRVEENQVPGIDFSLQPAYFLEADFRTLEGSPAVNATVLGKIVDENNSPISEAFVYLMNEDGAPVSFARSNAQGHYELSNVEPGRYKLKATHIGFHSQFSGEATSLGSAEALEITNGSYEVNLVLQTGSVTSVGGNDNNVPKTTQLYGNYPNPFNPTTQISFGLPKETEIRLSVYNLLGQKINELFNGKLGAGNHSINWSGRDNSGQFVPSGIYFYVLQTTENRLLVRKMTLLK